MTVSMKVAAFCCVALCSLVEVDRRLKYAYYFQLISLIIQALRRSETSVYFYETTQRSIPEGCHLHHFSDLSVSINQKFLN
jgi:hypothetical protein